MEGLPWGLMDSENEMNGYGGLLCCSFYLLYLLMTKIVNNVVLGKDEFFFLVPFLKIKKQTGLISRSAYNNKQNIKN